jgi:hypothetical protein
MRFNVADIYNTTLQKAGALVEFKNISAYDNSELKGVVRNFGHRA